MDVISLPCNFVSILWSMFSLVRLIGMAVTRCEANTMANSRLATKGYHSNDSLAAFAAVSDAVLDGLLPQGVSVYAIAVRLIGAALDAASAIMSIMAVFAVAVSR